MMKSLHLIFIPALILLLQSCNDSSSPSPQASSSEAVISSSSDSENCSLELLNVAAAFTKKTESMEEMVHGLRPSTISTILTETKTLIATADQALSRFGQSFCLAPFSSYGSKNYGKFLFAPAKEALQKLQLSLRDTEESFSVCSQDYARLFTRAFEDQDQILSIESRIGLGKGAKNLDYLKGQYSNALKKLQDFKAKVNNKKPCYSIEGYSPLKADGVKALLLTPSTITPPTLSADAFFSSAYIYHLGSIANGNLRPLDLTGTAEYLSPSNIYTLPKLNNSEMTAAFRSMISPSDTNTSMTISFVGKFKLDSVELFSVNEENHKLTPIVWSLKKVSSGVYVTFESLPDELYYLKVTGEVSGVKDGIFVSKNSVSGSFSLTNLRAFTTNEKKTELAFASYRSKEVLVQIYPTAIKYIVPKPNGFSSIKTSIGIANDSKTLVIAHFGYFDNLLQVCAPSNGEEVAKCADIDPSFMLGEIKHVFEKGDLLIVVTTKGIYSIKRSSFELMDSTEISSERTGSEEVTFDKNAGALIFIDDLEATMLKVDDIGHFFTPEKISFGGLKKSNPSGLTVFGNVISGITAKNGLIFVHTHLGTALSIYSLENGFSAPLKTLSNPMRIDGVLRFCTDIVLSEDQWFLGGKDECSSNTKAFDYNLERIPTPMQYDPADLFAFGSMSTLLEGNIIVGRTGSALDIQAQAGVFDVRGFNKVVSTVENGALLALGITENHLLWLENTAR